MNQLNLKYVAAGPADEQTAIASAPGDASEHVPIGSSVPGSDAPFLLTLVAVAAAEVAVLMICLLAA
ncbi:hypothetical protein GCM10011504_57680 [Siccirubricoccus deserti]|uniref:Uncharacterized protein n=1 Tax=Siccirubricoccus deserti TaxID=2013562 RepID=A0A9X0UGM8_9PROT|nr:hypothetical protein [Siccirubricoccus deserti]MBC4019123.1 hypothetical protein [Siccirubricoccus deserti]GGC72604.1 hypothetical protein GCM10011504_57680 [Siccirubricoccus deserti]